MELSWLTMLLVSDVRQSGSVLHTRLSILQIFFHLGFYKIRCSGKYSKLKFPLKWFHLVKEDVSSTSSRGINVTWCVRGQTNELNSPCSPSSPYVGNKPDTTKMSVLGSPGNKTLFIKQMAVCKPSFTLFLLYSQGGCTQTWLHLFLNAWPCINYPNSLTFIFQKKKRK